MKCIDEEIPFEIPRGWEWERWGNISQSIQYGYNTPALEKGVIKMVRISDIQKNKVLWETVPFCMIEEKNIGTYLLEVNDILFARTGGTVGKSFLVEKVPMKAIYAGYLIRTRYSSLLCPRYMKAFMESQLYWDQLKNGTIATAQPNCNGKILAKMLLPIPPINEQKRITEKLYIVSSFIERYSKQQDVLHLMNIRLKEQLKRSILQEAIQGKLVPQIIEEGTAQELLEQIMLEKQKLVKEGKLKKNTLNHSVIYKGDDNKYYEQVGNENINITETIPFDLPNNWTWVRLGQYVRMSIGKTPPRGDAKYWTKRKYPWVSISDMSDYGLVKATKECISECSKNLFREISPAGTLIMSFKLTVGRTSLLKIPAYHNEAIVSIFPFVDKNYQAKNYLFYILPIISNLGNYKDAIKGKTLNSKSLNNLLLPLPPLNEQGRIVAMIERLFDKLK